MKSPRHMSVQTHRSTGSRLAPTDEVLDVPPTKYAMSSKSATSLTALREVQGELIRAVQLLSSVRLV